MVNTYVQYQVWAQVDVVAEVLTNLGQEGDTLILRGIGYANRSNPFCLRQAERENSAVHPHGSAEI